MGPGLALPPERPGVGEKTKMCLITPGTFFGDTARDLFQTLTFTTTLSTIPELFLLQ